MDPMQEHCHEGKQSVQRTTVARPRAVIVGNPNTGKSTVFNALCGTRQRTGNFPGVTVERKVGQATIAAGLIDVTDLPGLYSLHAVSADERIAAEVVSGRHNEEPKPDLILFILDATNLKRNLFLYSQAAELEIPMVVVLTMTDLLDKEGVTLNLDELERCLRAPVVSVVPGDSMSIRALGDSIQEALADRGQGDRRASLVRYPESVQQERGDIRAIYRRYEWAEAVRERVEKCPPRTKQTLTDRLDQILTHRFLGLVIFGFVMLAVFSSVYSWARPLMGGIERVLQAVAAAASGLLAGSPTVQSLVADGVVGGVGSVVVFLPQIVILFLFIAVLEDTGYLARVAFMMDRLLGWSGLNGRSFIPMLSCYACAVPGVMGCRVIPDERARLATVLTAPLISCSARLPIYLLLIGAFVEPRYGPVIGAIFLTGMHVFGLFLALPIAFVLNRIVLRTPAVPFLLEMPPYLMPRWKNVVFRVLEAAKKFLFRAGTTIFAMSIVIWALSYFPRSESVRLGVLAETSRIAESVTDVSGSSVDLSALLEKKIAAAYLEQSFLGSAGIAIAPFFAPLGFDWKMTVGVLSAFPARETVIATLGIIYGVEGDRNTALWKRMAAETKTDGTPVYTPLAAVSLMVFFALCCQCFSTVVTVARELNGWRWGGLLFVYMTALAYSFSLLVFQLGRRMGF